MALILQMTFEISGRLGDDFLDTKLEGETIVP